MATITMDQLLAAGEKQELSVNDAACYLDTEDTDWIYWPDIFEVIGTPKYEPSEVRACAVGEAALQLARMASCPDLMDVGAEGGRLKEALAKCVEGTDMYFWDMVDNLHGSSEDFGLTRMQHIGLLWRNKPYLYSDDFNRYEYPENLLEKDAELAEYKQRAAHEEEQPSE